jgi:hypothetical protein
LVRASKLSTAVIVGFLLWLILQAYLANSGFYLKVSSEPFRFLLAAPPAILFIASIFISKNGRSWIETLSIQKLTVIHLVRIPVEITLYWFYLSKMIPELMTFSGRNFDILAGLTAPIIYYLVFIKKVIGKRGLLLWNFICLGLLLNIIISAVLSVPTSFQQLAFDQPNIAILHFPLVWLPTFVVPIVLFSHFATIYRLLQSKTVL